MTNNTLTLENFKSVLKEVAVDVKSHVEELRELDSVIGDGDLGITIELASKAMLTFLETTTAVHIGELLMKCGMGINKASPSTFGTLLAAAFLGGAKAIGNKTEIAVNELGVLGDGAVEGIKSRGKAEVGDKTMLDSVVPAVEAFKAKIGSNASFSEALDAAVKAAVDGMEATVKMQAKHGRASRHQAGTVEIRDGGATAMYYFIDSFARHLKALS